MSKVDEYDLKRAMVRERQLVEMVERLMSRVFVLEGDIAAQREKNAQLQGFVDDLVEERNGRNHE